MSKPSAKRRWFNERARRIHAAGLHALAASGATTAFLGSSMVCTGTDLVGPQHGLLVAAGGLAGLALAALQGAPRLERRTRVTLWNAYHAAKRAAEVAQGDCRLVALSPCRAGENPFRPVFTRSVLPVVGATTRQSDNPTVAVRDHEEVPA